MVHILPKLPYTYDALEPFIDAKTMEIHHTKHHQTYIDKLNLAIKGTEFEEMSVIELLQNLENIPQEIKSVVINHGGGHANHSLFWEVMGSNCGGVPSGKFAKAINKRFLNFEQFKQEFSDAAKNLFGSGWVWLTLDENKELFIYKSKNQDSPIIEGHTPLLGIDIWEHAYYLKYQNKRADYIEAWWNIVNWKKVEGIYISLVGDQEFLEEETEQEFEE